MLKVLGLAAIALLLLGAISCTQTSQKSDNTAVVATTTPAPTTPSPTPTAPTTASVKTDGLNWKDDASGTPVTTIKVGGTITWTNTGGSHKLEKVAAGKGCEALEDSFNEALPVDKPVTKTFTKEGIFGYHCGVHKGVPNCDTPPGNRTPPNMPGVIKVVP